MTSIALTRVGTIVPILDYLHGLGVRQASVLNAANLPAWISSDPEAMIPGDTPIRLFAATSKRFGIPNLGLLAGERSSIDELGLFGQLVRRSPTLGAALETAVRYQPTLTSRRPLALDARGERVEFSIHVADPFDPSDVLWQQDNQFCLGLMLSIVRAALGPNWRPDEVHLETNEALGLRDADSLAAARITFGQPRTMFALPRALLATPMPPVAEPAIPSDVIESWMASAPAHDFMACIRQTIETLSCGEDYPSVRETADFVGMSVRTLQRRLAAAGVSHDALVARSRFATAAAVLERTDGKITDLALTLGYSDHANFTRAFRHWAGCSPQEYRSRYGRRSGSHARHGTRTR